MDDGLRNVLADIANWTDSDTLASGTTTDLGSVQGMYVTVSGTATITGFGTLKAGMVKFVYFTGAGQVTHNTTSMILPGGANISRLAGDTAVFVSEGSGNWRCLNYQRVSQGVTGKGADIASATTTDLSTATGDYVVVTGTTTITGFGTAAAGVERTVRFSGALTLTHNATSLILLGGQGRTTAAGDVGVYRSEGSGNWREISYERAASLLRIDANGRVAINGTPTGTSFLLVEGVDSTNDGVRTVTTATSSREHMRFQNGNGVVGAISTNGTSTVYATSSDYRLKIDFEDVEDDRILAMFAELAPTYCRMKSDDHKEWMYLAHNLQKVHPTAVTGEKDGYEEIGVATFVDSDEPPVADIPACETPEGAIWKMTGTRPVYQAADYGRSAPLIAAALDVALRRIAALEERLG